jgi:hypothetical protein
MEGANATFENDSSNPEQRRKKELGACLAGRRRTCGDRDGRRCADGISRCCIDGRREARICGAVSCEFELSRLRPIQNGDGTIGFAANGYCQNDPHGEPVCRNAAGSGHSLDAAGDINGDGFADVLIGASAYGIISSDRRAFVVFGSDQGFLPQIDLHDLSADRGGDGSKGFVFLPAVPDVEHSYLGRSVAGAGDVNGDGFDDIILGDAAANPGGRSFAGMAYIVFGSAAGFPADFELSRLLARNGGDGHLGFTLNGPESGDNVATEVAGAGDSNGDGFADVLVNALYSAPSSEFFLVFGSGQPFPPEFELGALFAANGGDGSKGVVLFGLDGTELSRYGLRTISTAGDVNGDGVDDLALGIYRASVDGAEDVGRIFVVFGSREGFPAELHLSSLLKQNGGDGSIGFVINGVGTDSEAGHAVGAAGDVNADGVDDLVVNGRADDRARRAWVIFGRKEPFGAEFELSSLLKANGGDGSKGFVAIEGDDDYFIFNDVTGGGDVNGDGLDDLLLSSADASPHGIESAGRSYVLFGRDYGFPAEFQVADLLPDSGGDGGTGFVIDGIHEGDAVGFAGAVGDVNGDGIDEIIVSGIGVTTFEYSAYTYDDAGATYVIFGLPTTLAGKATGMDIRSAVCRNFSDPQTVRISLLASAPDAWDCERAGMRVSTGDEIAVYMRGVNLSAPLAGRADRLNGGAATICVNVTQGATFETRLEPDGRWDCSASVLPNAKGDVVSVYLRGVAR